MYGCTSFRGIPAKGGGVHTDPGIKSTPVSCDDAEPTHASNEWNVSADDISSAESDFGIATRTFMRARVRTAKFRPFLCVTATETMHVADESPCEGGRMVKPYQLHVLATMGSLW